MQSDFATYSVFLQHTSPDIVGYLTEMQMDRCEVLDQLESTQQNRSQPGQIKAQLIILIDKRRLHAWRQISLRKIDEQFLMYVCVIHSVLTSSQQAAMCQVGTRSMRIIFTTIIFKSFDQRLVRSSVD
ncbi:hypothetical protein Tsp_02355 [Trichinella spiralis]|uniref:hypothetical protein n=1 Tax=Trichinella spiralis TaxID=6334 RepID=UPI0001EFCEC6|nr:hypothetical protein Tsp_02355 [Trichinella spiralis]